MTRPWALRSHVPSGFEAATRPVRELGPAPMWGEGDHLKDPEILPKGNIRAPHLHAQEPEVSASPYGFIFPPW